MLGKRQHLAFKPGSRLTLTETPDRAEKLRENQRRLFLDQKSTFQADQQHSERKKVCTVVAPYQSSDHQFESKEPRYFQRGNYRSNMPGWEVLCFLVAGEPRRQQREVSKTLNESDFRSTVLYLADYQSTEMGTGRRFLLRTDGKRLGLLGFRLCTLFLDTLSFVKKI